MTKQSEELRKLRLTTEKVNPDSNKLPETGSDHDFGIAEQMMLVGGSDVFIEVDYKDEFGDDQRRKVCRGVWPIKSTRINGWRPHDKPDDPLNTNLSDNFQLTVIY